jgi:hypothetical protein
MRHRLLIVISLLALGCIADPTDFPYNGPWGSVGQRDSGGASGGDVSRPDAGPTDTGSTDAGPMDAGPMDGGPMDAVVMDAAPDAPPSTPEQITCMPDEASCEPVRCEGACEVDCEFKDARCLVDCATPERCALSCRPNTDRCEMTGCDAPIQCGMGWVCNGECGN